jgi:chromosomal replication initiation ATPase DnaA
MREVKSLYNHKKDAIIAEKRKMCLEIINAVCLHFQIQPGEVARRTKKRYVMMPRRIAVYLVRKYTGLPIMDIGLLFCRHHKNVLDDIAYIEENLPADDDLQHTILTIEGRMYGGYLDLNILQKNYLFGFDGF